MNVQFARPDASQLAFSVYTRTIHPELFDIYAEKVVTRGDFSARVKICGAGHVVEARLADQVVTEVTTTTDNELPDGHRCFSRRIRGQRNETLQLDELTYHASYQVEWLDPEVFLNFHEELSLDCLKAPLSFEFRSSGRLAPVPLSLVHVDFARNSLLIHSYHTFPENSAVVKTQSLFEM